jgi:hypothetical protein
VCVNKRRNQLVWDLKTHMRLDVRFICIETGRRKDSWRSRSFLPAINLGGPVGPTKSFLRIRVYYMQTKRLGNTVPKQKTISWSKFVGQDILKRSAKIWRFGLMQLILELFWGYLGPTNSIQLIICCVCRDAKPLLLNPINPNSKTKCLLALRGRQDYLPLKRI